MRPLCARREGESEEEVGECEYEEALVKLCWLWWLPKLAMGAKVPPGDLYCAERADSAPAISGLPCEIRPPGAGAASEVCCSAEE